jgi:hypothetical protein
MVEEQNTEYLMIPVVKSVMVLSSMSARKTFFGQKVPAATGKSGFFRLL